jgi:hypothetical protein
MFSKHSSGKSLQIIVLLAKLYVDCTVEMLLENDEESTPEAMTAASRQTKPVILDFLCMLYVFATACPYLLVDHVTTFQTYYDNCTHSASERDTLSLYYIIGLWSAVFQFLNPLGTDPQWLKVVEKSLVSLCLKHGTLVW